MAESLKHFISRRNLLAEQISVRKNRTKAGTISNWKRMDSLSADTAFLRSRFFSHQLSKTVYRNYRNLVRQFFLTGVTDKSAGLYYTKDGTLQIRKGSTFIHFIRLRMMQHDRTVRNVMPWFLITLSFFAAAATAAFGVVSVFSAHGEFFLPEQVLLSLQRGQLWTNVLSDKPVSGGINIIMNNVLVSFRTFVSGILLGIPSLLLVLYNGWHLGSILSVTAKFGMAAKLLQFVFNHGFLEITIILFSGALGLKTGISFFSLPAALRFQYFVTCFQDSLNSVIVFAFWLFVCGIVECRLSPFFANLLRHTLMLPLSCATGLLLLGLYIIVHHRGGVSHGRDIEDREAE